MKQSVHLGNILHVLIWKMHIQVFQCRKLLSTSFYHFSTTIRFFGYPVTNLAPSVEFYVVEDLGLCGVQFAEVLAECQLLFYTVFNVLAYISSSPSSDNNVCSSRFLESSK